MLLFYFWLAKVAVFHPFHVSVVDMEYETQEKHLKITISIFLDDLEEALQKQTDNSKFDILAPENHDEVQEELEKYLSKNLIITSNKSIPIQYLGSEVDVDVMWCYLEMEKLRPFKSLTVTNTILLEMFDDQENLVHVRKNGVVKSLRLMKDQPEGSISWD